MREPDQEPRFGLTKNTLAKINGVFAAYPQVERVILYGSRAKGNYRASSDIDLVVVGANVTLPELLQIEQKLDDLLLPYKIDLSLMHRIDDAAVLDHIRRVGVDIFRR